MKDKNRNQWTDTHSIMEELVCLGIAVGYVSYNLPKPMWSFIPGGVPYITINTKD